MNYLDVTGLGDASRVVVAMNDDGSPVYQDSRTSVEIRNNSGSRLTVVEMPDCIDIIIREAVKNSYQIVKDALERAFGKEAIERIVVVDVLELSRGPDPFFDAVAALLLHHEGECVMPKTADAKPAPSGLFTVAGDKRYRGIGFSDDSEAK